MVTALNVKQRASESMRAVSLNFVSSTSGPTQVQPQVPAYKPNPSEGREQLRQPRSDHQIDKEEKRRRDDGQKEDHHRRQQDFTTGRPGDLGDLCSGLLDELYRACHCRLSYSLCRS